MNASHRPRRPDRRRFIQASAAGALAAALPSCAGVETAEPFDVVVRGGTVVDGEGLPPARADLGIRGDTIAALGAIGGWQARTVIDATGLHVAPGFIDIHTHSDGSIFGCPTADSRLRQGVTTEVTGNCGGSAAPRRPAADEGENDGRPGNRPRWTDVASYAATWREARPAINHALLAGQGTIRRLVLGEVDRNATPEELREMVRILEEALDQGAIGLSTGLEYVPGIWTPAEEIHALARVVAARGAFYASHMRDEEDKLLEALREALETGRRTGVRVQVSHLKANGRGNWNLQEPAIALIEGARRDGVDVLADAYPYVAYSTGLSILLEGWVRDGGDAAMQGRLRDPGLRERIRKEVAARVRSEPGGFELIVIAGVSGGQDRSLAGRSIAQIAEAAGTEPAEAVLRILEAGGASFVGFGMSEENVERVLAHPLVMVASDGSVMKPPADPQGSRPHPRSYGTFPRVLARYARDRGIFDVATAVRKMTSMPADQAGLRDRGRLRRGFKADVVVFDAAAVRDEATFEDPHRFPSGLPWVLVNGAVAVAGGVPTGERAGRFLARA